LFEVHDLDWHADQMTHKAVHVALADHGHDAPTGFLDLA